MSAEQKGYMPRIHADRTGEKINERDKSRQRASETRYRDYTIMRATNYVED